MKRLLWMLITLGGFPAAQAPSDALTSESLEVKWHEGAMDCAVCEDEVLQVHAHDPRTFILRQSLCSTWEAPFLYLLIGDSQALLIDTGDVAESERMPLARTVTALLPAERPSRFPLIVVHTHGHLDHRAGDGQFAEFPDVRVVPSDLESVKSYFGFASWPDGSAELDLGGRVVDVLPAPGHHPAHVVFYDRNTSILFTGDFLLPGRILVDDLAAYEASARRVADYVKDRPVKLVLAAHIEKQRSGKLFEWQSTHHPDEGPLELMKADVLGLPAALDAFNGLYTEKGGYVIENPMRLLTLFGVAVLAVLVGLGWGVYRLIRRRRKRGSSSRTAREATSGARFA